MQSSLEALVSIIIPVYNAENYIDKCLESVCKQSYRSIEILLMVGLCDDNSLMKCINWQKKDSRIIIVSRKDTSLGDARNYGLNIAKGKYLSYVDADDYIEYSFIEEMVRPLEEDDTLTLTCCGLDKFDGDRIEEGWIPQKKYLLNTNLKEYMDNICFGTVWLKMYRREWIVSKKIVMFDGCHEDDAMHICLGATVQNVCCIQKPLYHYNIGNNQSLMHGTKQVSEYIDALRFAVDYLKKNSLFENNKDILQAKITKSLELHMRSFYYDEKLMEAANDFWKDFFPDIYEEKLFSKTYSKTLEKKIVLFGAGKDVNTAIELVGRENISYIVDNNPNNHGRCIDGILVTSFDRLLNDDDAKLVLISSSAYYYEIAKQLREYGIHNYMPVTEYLLFRIFYETEKTRRFVLFNTPEHTNVGDHAIAECIKKFLKIYFPKYLIIEITEYMYSNNKSIIKNYIQKEDIILITGGGFLGTLWMKGGEQNVREIITNFYKNKIIIFPQTMWFEKTQIGIKEKNFSKEIYEKAEDLTIMLREHSSYECAVNLFDKKIKCVEMPDIVLSMQVDIERTTKTKMGALCFKDDFESLLTSEDKFEIEQIFKKKVNNITRISMHSKQPICIQEREQEIRKKLKELSEYQIVITDCLHCMIFCALVGTPCIAFDNISGKLSGVYEWIKDFSCIRIATLNMNMDKLIEMVLKDQSGNSFEYSPFYIEIENLIK